MSLPSNILQTVTTYQTDSLAFMQNFCCLASLANGKFQNFQDKVANLGDTVNIEIPPLASSARGLVASFQNSQQLLQPLVCDQAANASRAFTTQQFKFNVDEYMDRFGRADITALGSDIEINLGLNAISRVPVMTINDQGQSVPTGALHTESGPYRFYGDGSTPINSYQQLQQAVTNFLDLGGVMSGLKMVLPNSVVPPIIGSGLNQFVPNRNNETAMSWELGEFGSPSVKYYVSNLLPTHTAGTLGEEGTELTVVSTNDPTGANVTQITCSGAGTDSNAIKSGDLGYFVDGVDGFSNMRFTTYYGKNVTSQQVQFRVTADAVSSAGSVTFTLTCGTSGLVSASGSNKNINQTIQAGMKIKFLPSHRVGLLISDNAFFLAMPMLDTVVPYPTVSKNDKDTGLSLRMYYGDLFGQNQRGLINDAIWGSTLICRNAMRMIFPL
jgi:hypothetical protein